MLYTGKGDDGTTGLFGTEKRISKASPISEALGSVDELNSLLGLCKVKADGLLVTEDALAEVVIGKVQQQLFVVQAELAGTDKTINKEKVVELEGYINAIEKQLPKIRTFRVAGGTELSALFDYTRAVSRRAERRVLAARSERPVGKETQAYLNRLSSLMYALSRLANAKSGITEEPPRYE
jgi:cob(I)alamin adenosyltransferase